MQQIRKQSNSKIINRPNVLRRITRKNLDLEKYTNCLVNTINYRIYAEYWYLDTLVGDNWDCFVWNDYEAIMPIPFVKKFGIKLIVQPIYCQQLGVFHSQDFSQEIFHQFERKLHRNFVRSYHFNEENTEMFSPKGRQRVNQVLFLNNNLEDKFDKKTKKNIKSYNNKQVTTDKEISFDELIRFKLQNSDHSFDKGKLFEILNALKKRDLVEAISGFYENELVGFCIFMKSWNRKIYINSSSNFIGRKKSVTTGLLFQIMKDSEEVYLDFEGSSVKTIYHFFQGFGAEERKYTVLKKNI